MKMKSVECWGAMLDDPAVWQPTGFLPMIALWVGVLSLTHYGAVWLGGRWSPLLAKRPTIVAGTVHAAVTGIVAVGVTAGWIDISWYHEGVLPMEMAHLMTDTVFYSIPNADRVMYVHHAVMFYCHMAMGSVAGTRCFGLDDGPPGIDGVRLLSLAGFVAEVPGPFMAFRWVMMKKGWHVRFPVWFFVNNGVMLVGWIGSRIVWFFYVFWFMLLPVKDAYISAGAGDIWWTMAGGYGVICALSIGWVRLLLKAGLRDYLIHNPNAKSTLRTIHKAEGEDDLKQD